MSKIEYTLYLNISQNYLNNHHPNILTQHIEL